MNTFDKDDHVYKMNDIVVPSITQLLLHQNFYISGEKLGKIRQEGIDNHSLIKMYFDTRLTFENTYLIAFDNLMRELESLFGELALHESPLFSISLKFAGTPDAVFKNGILEIKRSFGDVKRHALQIAGQSLLVKENGIADDSKIWIVAWFDGVRFRYKNVFDNMAEIIFKSLVKKYYIDQAINNYLEG